MSENTAVPTMNVALPVDAWNVVIEALAGMPYAKVYQVVAGIHQQIQQQQQPQVELPIEPPASNDEE